jgi:hypothetical protein
MVGKGVREHKAQLRWFHCCWRPPQQLLSKSPFLADFLLNCGCFIADILLALATCLQQFSNKIAGDQ